MTEIEELYLIQLEIAISNCVLLTLDFGPIPSILKYADSLKIAKAYCLRVIGSSGKGMLMFTVNNLASLSSPKAWKIRWSTLQVAY
jgi:hypothetical protein